MPAKGSRGPWLWPLVLTIIGILLLLNNFLLMGGFDVTRLWPLLLVTAGAALLLRGDWLPNNEAKTFGITRGSVESATVEIHAGEIDVQMQALQQEGRLIAGQYALGCRPAMRVDDTHAVLKMERAATPWLSFADWELGLARDLPWRVLVSTHLGQVNIDLSDIIVQDATIATGIGDIRLVCPPEAFGALRLQSALGNIHVITPVGSRVRITAESGRLFRVHADELHYEAFDDGVYLAREADPSAPLVEVSIRGTFGDAYLT